MVTARFLSFLYSIPPSETDDQVSQALAEFNTRLVEITCIYLIYRYTASTISAFIASQPKAAPEPTIAGTSSTLGAAWLQASYPMFNPLNGVCGIFMFKQPSLMICLQMSLAEVLGQNWARQVDDMQPEDGLAFFHLHDVSKRWLVINPTLTLEHAIIDFAMDVNADVAVFGQLTTYQHYSLLAAVFAVTASPNRNTSDSDWIHVVETFLDGLAEISHGRQLYESEHRTSYILYRCSSSR